MRPPSRSRRSVALIATQVVINTAMTVGLLPVTGLTLPLMSYGGSSFLSTCAVLGVVVGAAVRPNRDVTPMPFRFTTHEAAGRSVPVGCGRRG